MPYNPHHKERTRRSILFEAAAALRADGPDNIGVAAIMSKLGLTHGGFYAYFRSKDDLLAQSITEIFDERYTWFLKMTEGQTPVEGLSRFIDTYLLPAHRDMLEDGCAVPALASYVPHMSEACRARFADGIERWELALAKMLANLGRESPHELASSAIATMVGAISVARTIADREKSDAVLRAARSAVQRQLGIDQPSDLVE
jgi:TetR/AcrR family transcriptional repressor of nem operon